MLGLFIGLLPVAAYWFTLLTGAGLFAMFIYYLSIMSFLAFDLALYSMGSLVQLHPIGADLIYMAASALIALLPLVPLYRKGYRALACSIMIGWMMSAYVNSTV